MPEKPPIGLRPEKFHEETQNYERILEILDAMARYSEAGKSSPEEWVSELSKRCRMLRKLSAEGSR